MAAAIHRSGAVTRICRIKTHLQLSWQVAAIIFQQQKNSVTSSYITNIFLFAIPAFLNP